MSYFQYYQTTYFMKRVLMYNHQLTEEIDGYKEYFVSIDFDVLRFMRVNGSWHALIENSLIKGKWDINDTYLYTQHNNVLELMEDDYKSIVENEKIIYKVWLIKQKEGLIPDISDEIKRLYLSVYTVDKQLEEQNSIKQHFVITDNTTYYDLANYCIEKYFASNEYNRIREYSVRSLLIRERIFTIAKSYYHYPGEYQYCEDEIDAILSSSYNYY